MGKPVGMEIHGSKSLVITGLCRSGCMFWVLQVPATSTCQTMVFLFFTEQLYQSIFHTVSAVKIMYIDEINATKKNGEGGGRGAHSTPAPATTAYPLLACPCAHLHSPCSCPCSCLFHLVCGLCPLSCVFTCTWPCHLVVLIWPLLVLAHAHLGLFLLDACPHCLIAHIWHSFVLTCAFLGLFVLNVCPCCLVAFI